ncbi:MAG: hypothetical protein PHQ28_13830 [Mycobacterium sp.]|nr:hypothetical protein [Mycobacterium sp.]
MTSSNSVPHWAAGVRRAGGDECFAVGVGVADGDQAGDEAAVVGDFDGFSTLARATHVLAFCLSSRIPIRSMPLVAHLVLPGAGCSTWCENGFAAKGDGHNGKNPTLAVERKILRRYYHILCELGDAAALAAPVPERQEVAA